MISDAERLTSIERLIEERRKQFGHGDRLAEIWVSVAKDIRARMDQAPNVALAELERRMKAVYRSKTALGYSQGALQGVAEELIGRWPVVKQALERFGVEIEKEVEKDAEACVLTPHGEPQ